MNHYAYMDIHPLCSLCKLRFMDKSCNVTQSKLKLMVKTEKENKRLHCDKGEVEEDPAAAPVTHTHTHCFRRVILNT